MRQAVSRAPRSDQLPRSASPAKHQDNKGSERLGRYLRALREGYGYSLRKVEERARAQGGEIDNSQLSRYEKGICYPSFDKLRTLAQIFNVSIQTFSDVVELEEFERRQPPGEAPAELMEDGAREYRLGDYGQAYAHFQKARLLCEQAGDEASLAMAARARLAAAVALFWLGRISLSEYEIRQLLRGEARLDDAVLVQALLQLSNTHAACGDFLLAEMEAQRALEIALRLDDVILKAYAHHALGHIHFDRGELDPALEHNHAALELYREADNEHEALKVKLNLGQLYAARRQFRQGIRLLVDARSEARNLSHRWTVARAGSLLGEIHFQLGEAEAARRFIRESNTVAAGGDVQYNDILFFNAFYQWKMATADGNASEAKIAFGRLKYLRPHLEQTAAEVREFDQLIEKGGAS